MGFFSDIVDRVKSDMSYKASSGISNSISKGASKVAEKRNQPKCPGCKNPLDDGARFCTSCGHKMVCACEKCAKEFPIGTKFCAHCGGSVK